MSRETEETVQGIGLLVGLRAAGLAATLLLAATLPRIMGPDLYGQYALIASLAGWFVFCTSLGLTEIVTRYIPGLAVAGDQTGAERLFSHLLSVRIAAAVVAACVYLLFTKMWLRELDGVVLTIVAASVFVRSVGQAFFVLFLGLNRPARWGIGEFVTRWGLLLLSLPGYYWGGFRGVCVALLLTDLAMATLGAWWGRHYVAEWRPYISGCYIAPYLRFGLMFFAGNVLWSASLSSGEALVRAVASDYVEVSLFALAHTVYLTMGATLPQFALAFAAFLGGLEGRGDDIGMRRWTRRLTTWLTVVGVLSVYGVLMLGDDLVPYVLGSPYRRVTVNLVPLTLALLCVALSSVAGVLAIIGNKPRVPMVAAGIRLLAFFVVAPWLIGSLGSLGGCIAVLVASALHAAYLAWMLRDTMRPSLAAWGLTIALGALFAPLLVVGRSFPGMNTGLYGLFVVGYGASLFVGKMVTPREIAAGWAALIGVTPRRET